MDGLGRVLATQCGVVTRAQALRHISAGALRHLVESGRWQVPHHGIYLDHNGPVTDPQKRWMAVLGSRGFLAGTTALTVFGLRGFESGPVHVLLPARRRDFDPPPYVVVHRTTGLPWWQRTEVDDLPCTSAVRAAVDAAQWAGTDAQAAAVVAASVQHRLVGPDEVAAVLDGMPRARRRGFVLALATDLAGGAASLPEAEFLRICRKARFPSPKTQVSRRDARGRQRYLDAYFDGYSVHVEIDGGQHRDVAAWWADMRRQNDLWIAGDRVLRFPSWVVRTRPNEVAAQVGAALQAAGWRPTPRPRDLG
jgi:very-short-patch-repair endonuclease